MSRLHVLVDVDNVPAARVRAVLDALPTKDVRLVAVGSPEAVARLHWPPLAEVVEATGWQRADVMLARAYVPGTHALLLVSGDSDFGQLVARHDGPVMVVSDAASYRLRDAVPVTDPVTDGPVTLAQWLAAVAASS